MARISSLFFRPFLARFNEDYFLSTFYKKYVKDGSLGVHVDDPTNVFIAYSTQRGIFNEHCVN